MAVITFDFDDTMVMSHMLIKENKPVFVFDGYNNKIIDLIRSHIANGDDVHIVTARSKDKESLFPEFSVPVYLDKLSLGHYFTPERIHYTESALKLEILQKLGSMLHYDDSLEEISNNFGKIRVKNPFDFLKDSHEVGKAIIYDKNDRILLLRRTDEGRKWDIPGGHLKELEVRRPDGPVEGTEREIMEETGLLLPYLEKIGSQLFFWKGKSNNISFFQTKLEQNEPEVNLNMQDFQENSEYAWVLIDEMFKYAKNGTQILRSAVEMVNNQGLISEESRFQRSQKRKHKKMKKRLIGLGKNKSFGGGKGHKRPKMSRSKSAPAGFGALEEEDDKKKRKIKVKIVQKAYKAAIIKGNPAHLAKNKAVSDKFYNEIGQILKNEGFLVDFHDSKAHWWPGKPKKMVYDLWIGHSLGADRLEGAVEDGYTKKVIGFGVPNPEKQPFLAVNHPKDTPKPGKISGNEHYMLSDGMKMALKDIISAIKGTKIDEKKRKKRRKRRKKRAKYAYYGGYLPHRSDDYGSNGGDGGGGE